MRTALTNESMTELASVREPPCLSLLQPTHRRHPEKEQDPIRFRNLLKDLDRALRQQYPAVDSRLLLEPFEALAHNLAFWNHSLDGLAVFGGPSIFRVFQLQEPLAELATVASSFHIRPLRRFLQSIGSYHVLGLSLNKIRLFVGTRDALDEIHLASSVPQTVTDAPSDESTGAHLTADSHSGVGEASAPNHHGHRGRQDEMAADAERFFRLVDRTIFEQYSKPSALPLILAALPEHHHLFQKVSHNPFLMAEGLAFNPDTLTVESVQKRAWQVIEPYYQARLSTLVDEFTVAKSSGLGSNELVPVAQAAAAGRIATLLIESDRQIHGRLDGATGQVELAESSHPNDDLLADLGDLVEKMGGRVMVMATERMPGQTGLAATYRY